MSHQQSNNIHFLKTSKFFKKNHRYIFQLMNGGSVGTILQLLIFLFKAFATKETLAYFAKAGRLWNVSVAYILPTAFNESVQLMKFYFLPNENSNEDSLLMRELPFAIFNRSLSAT